jgi:hypothetical protein
LEPQASVKAKQEGFAMDTSMYAGAVNAGAAAVI